MDDPTAVVWKGSELSHFGARVEDLSVRTLLFCGKSSGTFGHENKFLISE